MNNEELKKRIEVIKIENDKINNQLQQVAQAREQLIQQALINNGRILELEELIKENEPKPPEEKKPESPKEEK